MRAYITRRCGCTDSAFYTRTCTRPLTKEPLVLFLTEIYGPITPKADYNEREYFFVHFFHRLSLGSICAWNRMYLIFSLVSSIC